MFHGVLIALKWVEGISAESLFRAVYFKMEVIDEKEHPINCQFLGISSMQDILYWEGKERLMN